MSEDWKDQLAKATGYKETPQKKGMDSKAGGSKLMNNYFYQDQAKDRIKVPLLEKDARDWAKKFIHPRHSQRNEPRNKSLNSSQLRRFHNDVRDLEAKLQARGFDSILPLVKMLKSKVAYACPNTGRGERKVPIEFREYIETMVDNIQDEKDFQAFSMCFEAVVGYFYGEGGR